MMDALSIQSLLNPLRSGVVEDSREDYLQSCSIYESSDNSRRGSNASEEFVGVNYSDALASSPELISPSTTITSPAKDGKKKEKHTNQPYTTEQIHYMYYHKEDLDWTWPDVLDAFSKEFKTKSRAGTISGLQCRFYRAQRVPLLCLAGKPILDEKGKVIMRELTLRQRKRIVVPILDSSGKPRFDKKGRVLMRDLTAEERDGPIGRTLKETINEYSKFVDRLPECAVKYKWLKSSEHYRDAKRKAEYRRIRGIVLPGAANLEGKHVKTVLVVNTSGSIDCSEGDMEQKELLDTLTERVERARL